MSVSAVRPLRVRPGVRHACAGDGLCCTDVHLLGPVARAEIAPIEEARPGAIVRGRHLAVLAPNESGGCTFLASDMRCEIHDLGIKPRSCTRYPFLLAATPAGGRIGTDHRCPCRTMGERPLLRVEDAVASIVDRRGRLSADRRIEGRIAIEGRRSVSFARYEAMEAELLGSSLLDRDTPAIASTTDIVRAMDAIAEAPTRWGAMHTAFARGIEAVKAGGTCAPFSRPWARSFARAEARSPVANDPDAMLDDWLADVMWALEWTFATTLEEARSELALRVAIARALAASIDARADTAMAEAIAIVEVAGLSEAWVELAASGTIRP